MRHGKADRPGCAARQGGLCLGKIGARTVQRLIAVRLFVLDAHARRPLFSACRFGNPAHIGQDQGVCGGCRRRKGEDRQ
jgi:hypothetical protein